MVLKKTVEMPLEIFEVAVKEYDCDWKHGRVTIKRFTYGDTVQIQQDSIKVKANSGMGINADINVADIQLLTILRGVSEAPWAIGDMATVKGLPPMVAEWVKNEIDDFNTINVKKKEN